MSTLIFYHFSFNLPSISAYKDCPLIKFCQLLCHSLFTKSSSLSGKSELSYSIFKLFFILSLFKNYCWVSQKRTLAFSLILLLLYFLIFLSFRRLYCYKQIVFTKTVRLVVKLARNTYNWFPVFSPLPVN